MNNNGKSKICITYTCLSDNSQIFDNIRWHQGLKAGLFILFLDKDIEKFKEQFAAFENILILQSACYQIKDEDPNWVQEAHSRLDEGYDFEKVLNVYHASKMAYEEFNCNWVISIDADELIYIPSEKKLKFQTKSETLPDFFDSIPREILQVRFEAAELIPIDFHNKNAIFSGINYFATFPGGHIIFFGRVLNRIMLSLNIGGKIIEPLISIYYFIFGYNIRNNWQDIIIKNKCKPYFLGYMGYKSAIKLPTCQHSIFSIHYWLNKWPHSKIKTLDRKYCLHFDIPSFSEYRKKSLYQVANPLRFQNRREIFEVGRSPDLSQAMEYYKTQIVVSEARVRKCKSTIAVFIDLEENLANETQVQSLE